MPCVTAPLSILGSLLTLLTLSRTKKAWTTYHRLFFSLSVTDILSSVGQALGPLPIPESTGYEGARGTTATCTVQGFVQTLGLASIAFGTMLMIYFLLVIRFGLSDGILTRRVEPFLQSVPTIFSVGVAVAGLVKKVYNPGGPFSCWVSVWPVSCHRIPNVPCTRGGTDGEVAAFFRDYLIVIPLVVWTFLSLGALLVVATTIILRYRSSRRFSFSNDNQRRHQREVIVQCILYGLFFANTLIWRTMRTLFDWADRDYYFFGKHYWITFLGVFFFPLQGLFNFIIFVRPRYLSARTQQLQPSSSFSQYGLTDTSTDARKHGRWHAFRQAILFPDSTMRGSSSRRRSQRRIGASSGSRLSPRGGIESNPSRPSSTLSVADNPATAATTTDTNPTTTTPPADIAAGSSNGNEEAC